MRSNFFSTNFFAKAKVNSVKNFRARCFGFLVASEIFMLAGCASTSRDSVADYKTVSVGGMSGIEKKQPTPTEDMNAAEKTGYYLGWLSLDFLYGWAGSNQPFFPP